MNRNLLMALGVLVLIFVVVWVLSAQSPSAESPSGNKVSLAVGEQKTVNGTTITVLNLVEDSRCPIDVQCIQAGTVRVRVALNALSRDFTFTLNEPQIATERSITLIDVEPSTRRSTVTVPPDEYRYTFAVDEPPQVNLKEYSNSKYGIFFNYPDNYGLTETEVGGGERHHYVIVLTPETDIPLPENGEGPPTITLDLFQNNLDNQTLLGWLKGSNNSNFKLGNGTYASTTVAGLSAVEYGWSGLYEGDSVAFIHEDNIVMISGMYLNPDDQIRQDFKTIITSFKLM